MERRAIQFAGLIIVACCIIVFSFISLGRVVAQSEPAPKEPVTNPDASMAQTPPTDGSQAPTGTASGDTTELWPEASRNIAGRVVQSNGQPIALADVDLEPAGTGEPFFRRSTRTGTDGTFEFTRLPKGFYRYCLGVKKEGYTYWNCCGVTVGNRDCYVTLDPLGRVSGRVIDAATHEPVQDFEIDCSAARRDETTATSIEIMRRDGVCIKKTVHDVEGKFDVSTFETQYDFGRVSPNLEFHEDGTLLPPEDGRDLSVYRCNVAVGVRVPSYVFGGTAIAPLEAGSLKDLGTIEIERGGDVEGFVYDTQQHPIVNASISVVSEQALGTQQTDERGHFKISTFTTQNICISAESPGYVSGSAFVTPCLGGTVQTQVVLTRGMDIEGTARKGGTGMCGVHVECDCGICTAVDDRADFGGHYVLHPLCQGLITVRIGRREQPLYVSRQVTSDMERTLHVDFDLPAENAVLEGRITLDGAPPASASLSGTIRCGMEAEVKSDAQADGQYRVEVPIGGSGILQLWARSQQGLSYGMNWPIELRPGQTTRRDFELVHGGRLTVKETGRRRGESVYVYVFDSNLDPSEIANYGDLARKLESCISRQEVYWDSGKAVIESLPRGSYTLVGAAISYAQRDNPAKSAPFDRNRGYVTRTVFQSVTLAEHGDTTIELKFPEAPK